MDQRISGPDMARGSALVLIALANVSFWIDPEAGSVGDGAWWYAVIRKVSVDNQAAVLFALLVGFGMAMFARSRRRRGNADAGIGAALVRRGAILAGIGAVQALWFPYEVLGVYGVCMIGLAMLASRDHVLGVRTSTVLMIVIATNVVFCAIYDGYAVQHERVAPGMRSQGLGVVENLSVWATNTVATTIFSPVLGSMALMVLLTRSAKARELWETPQSHRALLAWIAAVCLCAGCVLWPASWAFGVVPVSAHASGLLVAVGGVGLFAAVLWASSFPSVTNSRLGRMWSAAGVSSLSCYVLQSVFFSMLSLMLHTVHPGLTELGGMVLALGVWGLSTLLILQVWNARRKQAPLERVLRVADGR